jgi:hypothetical protein
VPFLRVTRDSRGYEHTFLLHSSHHGEEPRVLYWYRSAPGVKVGRAALDEDAIRTIEERHPDIEFDWPHILEVGATLPPEVERRPERPRRRPTRAPEEPAPAPSASSIARERDPGESAPASPERPQAPESESAPAPPPLPPSLLLDELVGREIAARLRERYADIAARLRALPEQGGRAVWQARADALNPDSWVTPEAVLRGVEHADRLFDELRRDLA